MHVSQIECSTNYLECIEPVLYICVKRSIGEKVFKSEKYIKKLIMEGNLSEESGMMVALIEKNGPYFPGKVKVVAMTL